MINRILLFLTLFYLSGYCMSDIFRVRSASMEPTLKAGDFVTILKSNLYKPAHNDLIAIKVPNENKIVIKRCIGIAGDSIDINNGFVFLNNIKLTEKYVLGLTYDSSNTIAGFSNLTGIIPDSTIVVLGDNRKWSIDSRNFGYLPIKNVIGQIKKENLFIGYVKFKIESIKLLFNNKN